MLKEISNDILNNGENKPPLQDNSTISQSNPELEEIEAFDLYEQFTLYNAIYFSDLLGCISVSWSEKMTSCAGVFSVVHGIPKIRLSEPLLKFRTLNELKETLLHEMIHAYCFVKNFDMSDDLSGHGFHFKKKMNEINKVTGLNITIYHSFHDEVDFYKKYVWRCNGKCRNLPPYFGYVRRQMNRPPQPADRWWKAHQQTCGGKYERISPTDEEIQKEKEEKKKKKKEEKKREDKENYKKKKKSKPAPENGDEKEENNRKKKKKRLKKENETKKEP